MRTKYSLAAPRALACEIYMSFLQKVAMIRRELGMPDDVTVTRRYDRYMCMYLLPLLPGRYCRYMPGQLCCLWRS